MKAKKHLGQNFLIDNNIINKISSYVDATEEDLIIEIGPGKGALTEKLLETKASVLCYEVDNDLKIYLNKLKSNKLNIVYNDFLSVNLKEDIANHSYKRLFIIGNLPYYITTPIIKKIINEELDVYKMIFMVQKEVAERFSAIPGNKEYGSITLFLKYYFNVNKLFNVSKYSFNPVPKVESAIIRFDKRNDIIDVNKEKYFKLIDDSFKMKRKTLKNNLVNYDFNKIEKVLNKYNLNDSVRAEELSEEVFISICNEL